MHIFYYVSERLKNDKEVVMNAVKYKFNGSCTPLSYASNKLKKDREIVDIAIKYAPLSFQDMDVSIRNEYKLKSKINKRKNENV